MKLFTSGVKQLITSDPVRQMMSKNNLRFKKNHYFYVESEIIVPLFHFTVH